MEKKGFTLIELIIVIIILTVIGGITVNIIYNASDAWQFIKLRKDISQQGRVAMERMARQIRLVRDASSVSAANNRTFSFFATDGITNTFSWSGTPGDSLLQNTNVLAENVQNFNLEYRDTNDAVVPLPIISPNPTNIWRIIINLSLTKNGQNISLESEVHPMNL